MTVVTMSDVNTQDGNGWTKLIRAAHAGDYDECRSLLQRGVDPDIRDIIGWTAVMYAAINGHQNIALSSCCVKRGQTSTSEASTG